MLSGRKLEKAINQIAREVSGQEPMRCRTGISHRDCFLVADDSTEVPKAWMVVDHDKRLLQLFVPLNQINRRPVECARALVADPLAVERGYRVEWHMVIAYENKKEQVIFSYYSEIFRGLELKPDRIWCVGRDAEFNDAIEQVRLNPEYLVQSLFDHAKEEVQTFLNGQLKDVSWIWPRVLRWASSFAKVYCPKFRIPTDYTAVVRKAIKRDPSFSLFSGGDLMAGWWGKPASKLKHDLSLLARENPALFKAEQERRSTHAKKARPAQVPDLDPVDYVRRLTNKIPILGAVQRTLAGMNRIERQDFLSRCLLQAARQKSYLAAAELVQAGAEVVVGDDGVDPLRFAPYADLLKKHPAYPNFPVSDLSLLLKRDRKNLTKLAMAGGNLNSQDKDGRSIAHLSAMDAFSFVNLEWVPGIDWALRDKLGKRPVYYLIDDENDDAIRALLEAGKVDFTDPDLLGRVRRMECQDTRIEIYIAHAKATSQLPGWALATIREGIVQGMRVSEEDQSVIERIKLEQKTAQVAARALPDEPCPRCQRPAHRGMCRL